ncbi:hypothetical protein [Streptomyces pseudovenezuelae]|uniref:hypothetical protein n=1 Tax=Streptomyces pseudovenezuelae TaxID=67350 RepID=UPI002E361306|nr:hypothetical protein [Streptomyces pseudovenezuelae]
MRIRLPSLRSALRVPGRQTATRALVAAVLAAAVVAQAVAALRPHVPPLPAATAASLAVEGVLHRWQRGMVSLFAKGQRRDEETAGASGTLTLPG